MPVPFWGATPRQKLEPFPTGFTATPAACLGLSLLSAGSGTCLAQESAQEIISRSVQVGKADWNAFPAYECFERDQTRNGSKTYDDMLIEGSPYRRLEAVDGQPLSPNQQSEQQQALERVAANRRSESPEDRQKRIGKYDKERQRDHLLLEELTRAFQFMLVGQQSVDNRNVYVLEAVRRPGYRPPDLQAEVLTGMTGRLWIDKSSYQWVKVTARVVHPVAIDGFLAEVEPGTFFELEKMPVGNNIWLPSHFVVRSRARILSFLPRMISQDQTYYGCHVQTPLS